MILVDTSVWIRFIANRSPFAVGLEELLGQDEVAGHDLVYGELLAGDLGGRRELLHIYSQFHQIETVPHREVTEFVRHRRLQGRGFGWIDIHLLASAVVARTPLWTADARLAALARELEIGFDFENR